MSEDSDDDLPEEQLADIAAMTDRDDAANSSRDDGDLDRSATTVDHDGSELPDTGDSDTIRSRDSPAGSTEDDAPNRRGDSTRQRDEFSSARRADTADRQDTPLGDLAETLQERRTGRSDDDLSDLFVSEETGKLDSEVVWEQIETGEISLDTDQTAETVEHVVEKAKYCQACEHFSEPPEVTCAHDGTDIVELVDMDRFRVRNCPFVEKAKRLGEFTAETE